MIEIERPNIATVEISPDGSQGKFVGACLLERFSTRVLNFSDFLLVSFTVTTSPALRMIEGMSAFLPFTRK